jgi:hypothetical protein
MKRTPSILGLDNVVISAQDKATIQLVRASHLKASEADMRKTLKLIITGALFGGLAATAVTRDAWATPVDAGVRAPSLTDQIYYRRYNRGGYYYRRGYNPGAAAAAAAAVGVLGAAAAAGAAGAYAQPYDYGYPAYGYPAYGYPDGFGW